MSDPLADITGTITATAALGTAAYGLVDTSKFVRGGPSNHGFGDIEKAVIPFFGARDGPNPSTPWLTLRANWLNGKPKDEQKAAAKGLVRLTLNATTAAAFAGATGVDVAALTTAAEKTDSGQQLVQTDLNALGRFDAQVSAILDACYERADQRYRNTSKAWACAVSVVLAIIGTSAIDAGWPTGPEIVKAILVGLLAAPLAPVAKDLSSSLQAAVAALQTVRK